MARSAGSVFVVLVSLPIEAIFASSTLVVARVSTSLAADEAEVTVVSSRVVDQALHANIPAGIIFIADLVASQMRWIWKAPQSIRVCSRAAVGIADG